MKRSLTLIMLALFVLNMVGYYGVFMGLKFSSEVTMRAQFDDESYANEEVTIKVPLAIPYANDSKGYERVDGEFEHNGQIYRLVKQKLQSDTLFIVCVKDNQTQKINQELADYVKTFTDKPVNSKSGRAFTFQFSKDFLSTTIEMISSSFGWNTAITHQTKLFDLSAVVLEFSSPPPQI